MTRPGPGSRLVGMGLARRLVLNNLLVILAGASTVLVTAVLVGPAVFEAHLQRVQPVPDLLVQEHVARAFDESILVSLGVGVLIAGVTAAAISWLVAKRLAAPVADAADVASRLADGRLDARVIDPRMGPEFTMLTMSVNELAHRLETTEQTRRQLTGELAHQLRTPVASISATIEAVREGVLPVDEETLATLVEQSHRLSRLVDDLEVVSRAQERQLLLNPAPVAISSLVDAAMSAHRESFRAAGVEFSSSVARGTPAVSVDPDRIQEVLGNLLDNALRHTPTGGSVAVAARPGDGRKRPAAVIAVKDTGSGFPAGDPERIFDRFEKAPNSTGSGLGLTIARAIVEAHHGTLTAHSDGPGEGARFTITLPASSLRLPE
jgi:two-component system sensor histidine kinase BaeS